MIYVNARFITQQLTGVQRYAFEVCIQMKKMHPGIIFLSPGNVIQHEWEKLLGVQKFGFLTGHLWEQIELPLYLLRMKKGVLFSPCNTGPLLLRNQWLTLHDIAFTIYAGSHSLLFRNWYQFLIPKLCKTVRHIFTVSKTVKNEISTHYGVHPEKISVTFNGTSAEMKSTGNAPIPKEKIVLTVGSLNERKNTAFLISGFLESSLAKEYKLVIIGKSNNIFKSISLETNPKIQWIENASDSQLKEFYTKAEIACFLSHYEGFGIPILESLQFQCKIICSDIPVFRELYSGAVHYCSTTNKEDFINLLNQISSYPLPETKLLAQMNSTYDYQKSAGIILNQLLRS